MHEQHRLRLKNRFLREGLDNFEPHNVLELLLFYSIPRKDVNDTAHDLINRFGGIAMRTVSRVRKSIVWIFKLLFERQLQSCTERIRLCVSMFGTQLHRQGCLHRKQERS